MTVEFPTSNFLLGCIVCLLFILVIFKVIKLIPSYRGYFEIRQKLNRQSTQRRYDSIIFDVRSPTDTVLQNSLDEQERNDDTVWNNVITVTKGLYESEWQTNVPTLIFREALVSTQSFQLLIGIWCFNVYIIAWFNRTLYFVFWLPCHCQ